MQSVPADKGESGQVHDNEGHHGEQQTHAQASEDQATAHKGGLQYHNADNKRSEDVAFRDDAARETNPQGNKDNIDQKHDEQGPVGSEKELRLEIDDKETGKHIDSTDEVILDGSMLASSVHKLLRLAQDAGVDSVQIGHLMKKIEEASLIVAVVALVKAGKSTLINAMVGQEFLPAMPEPETAVLVRMKHDPSFPHGRLLDKTGSVLCDGREHIQEHLSRMNRERRKRAMKIIQPSTVDDNAPRPPILGNYKLEDGSGHLALRSGCAGSGIFVTLAVTKDKNNFFGSKSEASTESGILYVWNNEYVADLFSDSISGERQKRLHLSFTDDGLQYSTYDYARARTTPRKSAQKKDGFARVFRAQCIRGLHSGYSFLSCQKGVERHRHPDYGDVCEDFQYWHPGDAFAIKSVTADLRWIQDYADGWVPRFRRDGRENYFEFMVQDDKPLVVRGEPVKIAMATSDGPLAIVVEQPTKDSYVKVQYCDRVVHEAVSSLQPVGDIISINFTMGSQGSICTTQFEGRTYSATMSSYVSPDSNRSVLFERAAGISRATLQTYKVAQTQLEDETMVLLAPIRAFESPTLQVGGLNMELMDTPGSNEAHAGLDAELQKALRKADVILYVLDYTKIGTDDEAAMFQKLKSENGGLMDSIDMRFWFLLNKIDVMKVNQDLESVLKSVADRVTKMCGKSITPDRIIPISCLEAFLGRQDIDVQRVNADETFQEEFLKNAVKMYRDLYDKEDWPQLIAKLAPKLIAKSKILDFESRVLHAVVDRKQQILSEKVFSELSQSLSELNNNVTAELKLLQSSQETLRKQMKKMQVIQSSFKDKLDLVKRAIDQDDYRSEFLSLVDKHFSKMQHDLRHFISELFFNPHQAMGNFHLKSFTRLFDPTGRIGSFTATQEEDIKAYLQSKDEAMLSSTEHAYTICCTQLSLELMRLMGPLQAKLLHCAQPVLDSVLKETGSALDVDLMPEKVIVAAVDDIDIAQEMATNMKHVQTAVVANNTTIEATRIELHPWYFLWLWQWGTYKKVIKYQKNVTQSYTVDCDSLKQRWLSAVDIVSNHTSTLAREMLERMLTSMVSGVTGAIEERVASLLDVLTANQADVNDEKDAVAHKIEELTSQRAAIQKALKYEVQVREKLRLAETESASDRDWEIVTIERQGTESDVLTAAAASQTISAKHSGTLNSE